MAGFAYLFLVQPAIAQQEEYPYAVFLDEDATETASTLCGFLIRQLEDCAGQYQVAVQYGFKTLAAYLANHYRTREDLSEKLGIFTRAVQYLQYNAARPIKLQEVAEAAGMSKPSSSQIYYIDLSEGDSAVVYQQEESNLLSRLLTSLNHGIYAVVEYFE